MESSQCLLPAILRKFRPATWMTLSLTGIILILFTSEPLHSGYEYLRKLDLPSPQPLLLQCVYMLTMIVVSALLLMLSSLAVAMLTVWGSTDLIEEEVIIPNSVDPETRFFLRTTSVRKSTFADDVVFWVVSSVAGLYLVISIFLCCLEPDGCPRLGSTRKEQALTFCVLILVVAVFNTCGFGTVWFAKYHPSACVDDCADDDDDKGGTEDSVATTRTPLLVTQTDKEDRSLVVDSQV